MIFLFRDLKTTSLPDALYKPRPENTNGELTAAADRVENNGMEIQQSLI
jgi:hypothetical protein